jgi:hypothetical protein
MKILIALSNEGTACREADFFLYPLFITYLKLKTLKHRAIPGDSKHSLPYYKTRMIEKS